jgi:large subunit ribosomal protein L9
MKVILLKDVPNLGKENQILDVKDGYAKNYLIKNNLAVIQTALSLKFLNEKLQDISKDNQHKIQIATTLKQQIENLNLIFHLNMNVGKIFGSISHKQIIDELTKHNITIDKYMFMEQKKNYLVGNHIIGIKLHSQVIANLKINIIGK